MIDLNEVPSNSNTAYVAQGAYQLQCIQAEFGKSSKDNPMITLTFEIVSPETSQSPDGEEVQVVGAQVRDYLTLVPTGFDKIKELHRKMGLSMDLDENKPDTMQYVGKIVIAIVATDQKAVLNEITNEPIIDPETGKKVVKNQRRLVQYL